MFVCFGSQVLGNTKLYLLVHYLDTLAHLSHLSLLSPKAILYHLI